MTTQVPDTVTSMLMRALSDPGSITERKTLHVDWDGTPAQESLTAWQARAVLEIVPPLIARAERERIAAHLADPGWQRDLADAIVRIENNYCRETSAPGTRFEGKRLEDVQIEWLMRQVADVIGGEQ